VIGQINFAVFVAGFGVEVDANGRKVNCSCLIVFEDIVGDLFNAAGVGFSLGKIGKFGMVGDIKAIIFY
jgi:hypothetical protein